MHVLLTILNTVILGFILFKIMYKESNKPKNLLPGETFVEGTNRYRDITQKHEARNHPNFGSGFEQDFHTYMDVELTHETISKTNDLYLKGKLGRVTGFNNCHCQYFITFFDPTTDKILADHVCMYPGQIKHSSIESTKQFLRDSIDHRAYLDFYYNKLKEKGVHNLYAERGTIYETALIKLRSGDHTPSQVENWLNVALKGVKDA
jgi:hypothetical protein